MMFRIPEVLKKGDKVALVATSKFFPEEKISFADNLLQSWGLKVEIAPNARSIQDNFAGTLEERRIALQNVIDDPEVKAIFCLRGGYGAIQLIDLIDWSGIRKAPKWLIGFSDICVFHHFFMNELKTLSIHGTMPINYAENTPSSIASLKAILFEGKRTFNMDVSEHKSLEVSGRLIGGNLSILYSLIGTPFSYDNTEDLIFFIEDLTEMRYHLERMLYSVQYTSWFDKVQLILVGHFSNMQEGSVPFGKDEKQILKEFAVRNGKAIYFGLPVGHENHNEAFVHGALTKASIKDGQLYLQQVIS